jgi:hypothetical protein
MRGFVVTATLSLRWLHAGILLICTVLSVAQPLESQSAQKNSKVAPSTAVLAKPVGWESASHRLFQDDARQVTFSLMTSWIPGANHKGMLRYKLTAIPKASAGSSEDAKPADRVATEKFVNRVHLCSIFLNLYDHGGFILRRHEVSFAKGVDDDACSISLYANDALQMDADEYRLLVSEQAGGAWGISWNCYENVVGRD